VGIDKYEVQKEIDANTWPRNRSTLWAMWIGVPAVLIFAFLWFSGPEGYQCALEASDGSRTWYSYGAYKEQPACTLYPPTDHVDDRDNYGDAYHICRFREPFRDFVQGYDARTSRTVYQDAAKAWPKGNRPPGVRFTAGKCFVSGWRLGTSAGRYKSP